MAHQTQIAMPDFALVSRAIDKDEWRGLEVSMITDAKHSQIEIKGKVPSTQALTELQQAVNASASKTPVRVSVTVQSNSMGGQAAR